MQKLITKDNSYKSPRIQKLLDLILNGVDPDCLPLDNLEVSTFERTGLRSFLGYYYNENNQRRQFICKSQNRDESIKLFKNFLTSKIKILANEAGIMVKEYTLSTLQKDFIKHKRSLNRDEDTIEEYDSTCQFLINTFGDIPLASIDLTKAQSIVSDGWVVRNGDKRSGQAPATKGKFVRHCKSLFNYAKKYHVKHLPKNVWRLVEIPTTIPQPKGKLSSQQFKLLIDHIGTATVAKRTLSRILILSLLIGTRINELLHTKEEWLDRENKLLDIQNYDEFRLKERKDKFIDVEDFFIKIWDEQISDNISQGLISEFLFPHPDLGTISYWTIQKQLLKALKATKLYVKGMGFHVNRAGFGKSMSENGASVRDIQKYYGHSTLKVTEKYLGISDDRSKRGKKAIAKHTRSVSKLLGYDTETQNLSGLPNAMEPSEKISISSQLRAYFATRSSIFKEMNLRTIN